ncbi:deoxyribonuclease IV [Tepidibacillus marianensis]|uniref:deoxyribonuclease IV n=1 Tax=Tepidibacillus marianensis TaxID=3131995 RepID=UPI0030CF142E
MYFGSHVSICKGYLRAAETALAIEAKSFQYFSKNPRGLGVKTFNKKDAERCAQFSQEHGLLSIAHTTYPTNLATEGVEREKMIQSVLNDLEITEACGSIGLVVHFGVYKGKDPLHGYQNIIVSLNEILSHWDGKTLILLENQAGQGVKMGTTMEELTQIRNLIDEPEKTAFCLDTCHAFASGLWTGENQEEFLQRGKELNYLPNVKAIHLNDSIFPIHSFRDRHANIGNGYIGEDRFKKFLKTTFVQNLPIILETPEGEGYTHKDEILYLYRITTQN